MEKLNSHNALLIIGSIMSNDELSEFQKVSLILVVVQLA